MSYWEDMKELCSEAAVPLSLLGIGVVLLGGIAWAATSCENRRRAEAPCAEFGSESPCDVPARCVRELGVENVSCARTKTVPVVTPVVVPVSH